MSFKTAMQDRKHGKLLWFEDNTQNYRGIGHLAYRANRLKGNDNPIRYTNLIFMLASIVLRYA